MEAQVCGGDSIDTVRMGLEAPRPGLLGRLRYARAVLREVAKIRGFMARTPVDVVLGLGGYGSVPGILAARIEEIPVILLEQNVRPGRVNRLFGPLADCVAVPGPESLRGFGALRPFLRLEETGNPLRKEVTRARRWRQRRSAEQRRRALGAGERRVLLIMGGSQGARAINDSVMEALPDLEDFSRRIYCIHITGNADKETVEDAYRRAGWTTRVAAFEPDLPELLAGTDLVLARAGGTSVAELAAIGVPSFLVPYPGHGDRHQFENARALSRKGAAVVLEEAELKKGGFGKVLGCLFDEPRLAAMGRAALDCSRVDGVERVISLIDETVSCMELDK